MFNPETYLLAVPKGCRPWIQLVCSTPQDSLGGPHPPYLVHFLCQCSLFPESSISLLESRPSLPTLTESSPSLHPPPPPPERHTHTQATAGSNRARSRLGPAVCVQEPWHWEFLHLPSASASWLLPTFFQHLLSSFQSASWDPGVLIVPPTLKQKEERNTEGALYNLLNT